MDEKDYFDRDIANTIISTMLNNIKNKDDEKVSYRENLSKLTALSFLGSNNLMVDPDTFKKVRVWADENNINITPLTKFEELPDEYKVEFKMKFL